MEREHMKLVAPSRKYRKISIPLLQKHWRSASPYKTIVQIGSPRSAPRNTVSQPNLQTKSDHTHYSGPVTEVDGAMATTDHHKDLLEEAPNKGTAYDNSPEKLGASHASRLYPYFDYPNCEASLRKK